MEGLKGNLLIAQGGGPTAVINESLVGATLEARGSSKVEKVLGAVNGVNGIINSRIINLTEETAVNLRNIAKTPSSALLSTRDKPDREYCKKIFKALKAYNVKFFFYIGGNDSSDTLRIVKEFAADENYEFRAVHIPKTVDNDLVLNDHTPGYPSAARFVAEAFIGLDLDNRSLPGVYIAVVMGRNAGFLTAASSMARRYEDDGPHLIYLPERTFDTDKFIDDVKRVYSKYDRCVVAVSEGVKDKDQVPVGPKLAGKVEYDAHGNIQLSGTSSLGDALKEHVKENTNAGRVRADTFGYMQRSFRSCVSDVDRSEAKEVGEKAIHYGVDMNMDGSITINRIGDYGVDYGIVELQEVAAKTRKMPDDFINEQGNDVTDNFRKYVRPLLGSDFIPGGARLRAPLIEPERS